MLFISRRIYLVKKDFQGKFILRFVLSTTVWILATVSLLTLMLQRRLEDVLYSPHINIRTSVDLLMPSTLQAHLLSLVLFTAILLYAIHALWRRLAPPLYSLKKDIARVASGDLAGGVALREDEEFQDLAQVLDGMRTDLRQKFIRIKEREGELSAAVAELDRSVLKGNPSLQQTASLKSAAARMREELNGFLY